MNDNDAPKRWDQTAFSCAVLILPTLLGLLAGAWAAFLH